MLLNPRQYRNSRPGCYGCDDVVGGFVRHPGDFRAGCQGIGEPLRSVGWVSGYGDGDVAGAVTDLCARKRRLGCWSRLWLRLTCSMGRQWPMRQLARGP
jgi:hypothetical protein